MTTTQPEPDWATSLEWHDHALCAGTGVDFFNLRTKSHVDRLRAICDSCPVSEACLEYALFPKQKYGMWAGTTNDERIEILRTHPRAVAEREARIAAGGKPMGNPRHREAREAQ